MREPSDWDICNGVLHRCSANGARITVPDGVKEILPDAFRDATIQCLILPSEMDSIMPGAFRGSRIQQFILPTWLRRIEAYAFAGCSVRQIDFPETLSFIGESAFEGCNDLRSVSFGGSLSVLGTSAFAETGLLKIELPCKQIGAKAFWKCYDLKQAVLKDAMYIDSLAFAECRKLSKIEMNDGILSISACAFWNCEKLDRVYIPDSVQEIGFGCFNGIRHIKIEINEKLRDAIFDKGNMQLSWVPEEYIQASKDSIHIKVREISGNAGDIVFRQEV